MVITISGMIGVGKTTVAKAIAEELNSEVFLEKVDDSNPLLKLFYESSEEENLRNRYPFLLQLFFLNTRFKSIKEALTAKNNVLDRSIYEDWYFAKINKELGRISDIEFNTYESLLNNMMEEIDGMPKKAPDLMIYLYASFDTILKRIQRRNREYELDPNLKDYYYKLWEGYTDWINQCYNASPVIMINMDDLDINNEKDKSYILNLVKEELNK